MRARTPDWMLYAVFVVGALLWTPSATVLGQLPKQTPKAHAQETAPSRRAEGSQLSDIAQSATRPGTTPVPIVNYIDRYVFDKIKRDGIPHAGLSTDDEFLRRIYLDLTGRLPDPDTIQKFLADHSPDKRVKLIDALMATPEQGRSLKLETPFLDRWTYFFCDLFEVSVPHMEKGRTPFGDYIHLVLLDNVPLDRWVTELITAQGRSNWLDAPLNFLTAQEVDDFDDRKTNQEDTDDAIAINTGKLFLGINLECVSCHDGRNHLEKINLGLSQVTRDQFWRQAAFFSKLDYKKPYSIAQEFSILEDRKGYDVTTRSVQRMPRYKADVSPQFLLTGERPQRGENWRQAFARMLTSNPQFARATANLFWAELLGVGIVDPPFSFDLARQDPSNPPPTKPWTTQPANPELLKALAEDFRDHHFDLRHLIRTIVTSSTYQLSSHFDGEWKVAYEPYFARHYVRRLDPEMIADAVDQATGIFSDMGVMYSDRKAKYVLQTYGPEDVRGKGLGPLSNFLHLMGQGYRVSPEKDSSGSMVEASALLNSRFVREQIKIGDKGRLHDLLNHTPPLSNAEIVDQVFLSFLCRLPSPKEKVVALEALEQRHGQGLEDLAWSLINMPQFILNY